MVTAETKATFLGNDLSKARTSWKQKFKGEEITKRDHRGEPKKNNEE